MYRYIDEKNIIIQGKRILTQSMSLEDVTYIVFDQGNCGNCYAVANAPEDLKKYATEVILSNDEDGVAKWL